MDAPAWRTELSERVSDIEQWQRKLEASMAAQSQGLADVQLHVGSISSDLRSFISEVRLRDERRDDKSKVNWGAIIALATLLVMILGGFTTLLVAPMSSRIERDTMHLMAMERQLNDIALWEGRSEGKDIGTEKEIEMLWKHAQEAEQKDDASIRERALLDARMDAVQRQIDAVDYNGARKRP